MRSEYNMKHSVCAIFTTQVVASVQALEEGGDPVVVAINAASAALCVSNIPWDGPAGCVRIGAVDVVDR